MAKWPLEEGVRYSPKEYWKAFCIIGCNIGKLYTLYTFMTKDLSTNCTCNIEINSCQGQ